MHPFLLIAVYSLVIVSASLLGGWLPSRFRLSHTRMQVILSFVGGLMLGIGLLHLLPHGVVESGSLNLTVGWTLIGLLSMFFLIRAFHFHQHGPAASVASQVDACGPGHEREHHHDLPHQPPLVHQHAHDDQDPHDHGPIHGLSWAGVATGLAVHTMLDGIALGAAVMADARHLIPAPWGLGVFIAIAAHKPLDALSITTLMSAGGWSGRAQAVMNLCFALMCPLGALLFALGLSHWGHFESTLLGMTLGFSAGTFLCISLSDLLPEVQFHQHDRFKLSAALLLGVVAAYGIGFLEPQHVHSWQPNAAGEAAAAEQ